VLLNVSEEVQGALYCIQSVRKSGEGSGVRTFHAIDGLGCFAGATECQSNSRGTEEGESLLEGNPEVRATRSCRLAVLNGGTGVATEGC
jgi:hypothetical protein